MRAKNYFVCMEELEKIFTLNSEHSEEYYHFYLHGAPEGSKIHNFNYSYLKQGFDVIITHESFEDVPEGHMIPDANGVLKVNYARVKKPEFNLNESIIRKDSKAFQTGLENLKKMNGEESWAQQDVNRAICRSPFSKTNEPEHHTKKVLDGVTKKGIALGFLKQESTEKLREHLKSDCPEETKELIREILYDRERV